MGFSPPLAADRHVGRVLKGTYQLEAKIGVGGFGAVYRARHTKLGSPVAVKFLLPHADDLARQRFEREAKISASIIHPNVARVMDIDHDDEGSPYMVMEWCEGASLRALLTDRGSLTFGETVELYQQFCSAMDAAHAKGVVHRDLKPENLLLSDESGVIMLKVLDFGIARMVGSQGTLTHGVAIGTPCYMAPESARVGSASADRRVDVYAMGLLLYECLTGQKAIEGEPMDIFARQLTGNIVISSVNKLKPELPPELDHVISRACAREPEDRFATAGDLAIDLTNVPPPTEWSPPTLRDLPRGTGGARALTPALLTPGGPFGYEHTPSPSRLGGMPTPLPPPVAAQVSEVNPLPPAAFMLDDDELISVRKPGWRLWATIGVLLAVGGVAAYFLTARETTDAPPSGSQVRAPSATSVVMRLKGAPIGARAYDLDHPAVPLPLAGDQLTLPRSEKAMRLRLEAPGYEKIQIEVIPEADGEINFGPTQPPPAAPAAPPAK